MHGATLSSDTTSSSSPDFSITPSHYGYIHTKLRKFIIVALFAQHYVALPMYTHNGDGLDKKPDKNEFVSVRDARTTTATNWRKRRIGADGKKVKAGVAATAALSDHEVLIAEMRPETTRLYEKTTVHVAYAVSRNYQLRVHWLGDVEAAGVGRLVELWRSYMGAV